MVTDWDRYLACTVCEAKTGGACFELLSAGPDALPSRYAEVPHSARKLRGALIVAGPAKPTAKTGLVARRSQVSAARKVSGWEAVAARQRKAKETR